MAILETILKSIQDRTTRIWLYITMCRLYFRVTRTKHDGKRIVIQYHYLALALETFRRQVLIGETNDPLPIDVMHRYIGLLTSISNDYGRLFDYSTQMLQYHMGIDTFPPKELVFSPDIYQYSRGKPFSKVS